MATTTFADGVTLTAAAWFNDVDYITYDGATTEILVGGGAGTRAVWTAATGTGAPVRANTPTLITPVLGVATGTSLVLASDLTLATGSVTSASGAITFGNENLSTTGTLAAGATTVTGTLSSTGNITVSGVGPSSIGGAIIGTDVKLSITGSFTTAATNAYGLFVDNTLIPAATGEAVGVRISPTLNKAGSGTHADFVSLQVIPPTIGAGASTLTNASTLKITDAPTAGTNNYALWVDAGTVRLDGTTGAGAGAGTLTNAPTAGDPAYWMPVNANGTTYYIPCWP